jgi:ribosomal protein S18 acetylase RimI-like enzyme
VYEGLSVWQRVHLVLQDVSRRRRDGEETPTLMFNVRDDHDVDLDALARLRERCEFTAKSREFLAALIAGSRWIVHAYDSEHLIGFARVISDGVTSAYVSSVMVDAEYRRRGVGRAMIELLMRGRESIKFVLHTQRDAAAFYRELGFADATDMMVRDRR